MGGEFGLGGLAVDREGGDSVFAEPFDELVGPITDEGGGASDDTFLDGYFSGLGRLFEESPHEGDALESFTKAHFVGHDTAVCFGINHPSGALV